MTSLKSLDEKSNLIAMAPVLPPVIIPFRLSSTLNDQTCKSVRELRLQRLQGLRVVKCERKCFKYPELRELAKPTIFPAFSWLALGRKIAAAAAVVANNSISSEGSSFVNSLLGGGGGATHVLGQ